MDRVRFTLPDCGSVTGIVVNFKDEDINGVELRFYKVAVIAGRCDAHRDPDGELWINDYEIVSKCNLADTLS